jgi:class 3 adenylate cyclase
VVKRTTEGHGGTVVKNQGDGFMLAFASARRAATCAQAIETAVAETFRDPGSPIRVRIGLHVGETVHEGDDHFGHAVNYAARVASAASGGEIVVSSLVHGLLAQTGEFEFETAREVELKGIEGAQRVYPLVPRPLATVD